MPKEKNKIKKNRNNYFCMTIGIFIFLLTILIIGRVGQTKYLGLCISVIFGDYSILVLLFLLIYSIMSLILNHKFDFHHIYFLGIVFIYLGLSLLSHLNIYDNSNEENILQASLKLYGNYFKSYNNSYSTGGGFIGTILSLLSSFIAGRIGIILLGTAFIVIGIFYLLDIRVLKMLKKGHLIKELKNIFKKSSNYFSNIKIPQTNRTAIKTSILKDSYDEPVFTLQEEINKELLNDLKVFIMNNKLYCTCDKFYTSYTSSRFVIKLAHKNEELIKGLKEFFNRRCFILMDNLEINIEIANSFKKLLALKATLEYNSQNNIFLALDINSEAITLDFTKGRLLTVVGDYSSGVKTFVRSILSSLIFAGINPTGIYIFDLFKEYEQIDGCINYISNQREMLICLDDGFSEYERRNETLKYLDCDNIVEANKKIKDLDKALSIIEPRVYIITINKSMLDEVIYSKITYLIKFGLRVGFNIIIVSRDTSVLSKISIQNSDIVSFYLADITDSIKLFGSDIAARLQKKGDVLIQSNSKIRHGQAPYISLEDFINVFKHL